ncbi:MAG TPA: BtaA family protein [Phycisphaerae bacterium]|nr:BtaA family protein [Phycisphaerae bacterium]HRW51667.1 BtaA family protein [Phycisphaerae bacterium]
MYEVINMPTPEHRGSLLERLVFRGLVFNMSWEDPEMDRRAFQLSSDDTVISITSAGCNPLNFLAQTPKRLICIDGNPVQNAVMELKLAAIDKLDHAAFFDIFAARRPERLGEVYTRLRPTLSETATQFWDRNLKRAIRGGLYRMGRMGLFCRIMRSYLKILGIRKRYIEALFECKTLDEQRQVYEAHIAPKLWRAPTRAFLSFKPLVYLAGVHPEQFRLVDGRHDMYLYVRERIEHVLTRVPISDNYFLSQTVTGRFRGDGLPPYLLEENFEVLRDGLDRVTVVNGWLGPYLDTLPTASINKFNLLDIFDWMTPEAFQATMESALRVAAPGATMIYRSGSYQLDPPSSIRDRVHHHDALSKELLAIDRSATYGSFYVLSVTHAEAA